MNEQTVNQNGETRQLSNKANKAVIVFGTIQLVIAIVLSICKSICVNEYFLTLQYGYLIAMGIVGGIIIVAGIYSLVQVNRVNKSLAKNLFPYNFNYYYELAVYKNIGEEGEKKIDGKTIEKLSNYSDWKDHITKQFEDNSLNDKENFSRFLNKRMRNAKLNKDMIAGILLPIELGIITLLCDADNLKMIVKCIYAVISSCFVMFLCMNNQYNYGEESNFAEDVIEIVNPSLRKKM